MYGCKDRMRAVALYVQPGKRPQATICELGDPGRSALKARYLEYER